MAKRKVVLFAGLGFLFGVLSAGSGWNFYLSLLAGGLLLLSSKILKGESLLTRNYQFEIIAVVCVFLGFFYYHFYLNLTDKTQEITFNAQIPFSGIVVSPPETKENYQKAQIELESPYHGKITILTKTSPTLEYGDLLKMTGRIEKSDTVSNLPISFFPTTNVAEKHRGFWLKEKLVDFKNQLTSKFKSYFSSDESALISGITFGERAEFSRELKNQMAASGVTHIVALSGYNIAILAIAIEKTLKKFLSRKKRLYVTLAIILLFVMMVGGEASVVRAAIMGSLVLLAQHLGRPHDTLHIIILTAVVMVLIDPTIISWNIGFQLSFLSLLGIVYLEPALRQLFRIKEDSKEESPLSWRENGLTTISAQLAVLPILIINFNQFSLTSIFANVLILFTVPFTMFLGFLFAGLTLITGFFGFLVAKLASILLFYQIGVIKIFSTINLPVSELFNSRIVLVIYYGALLAAIFYPKYKNKKGATEVAPVG